jgi:hypothetical protein
MWTGTFMGQLLVGILIVIGLLFLSSQDFTPISILFSVFFLLPMAVSIHMRLVSKGKRLMRNWCDVKLFPESMSIQVLSGYPNTMIHGWKDIPITDDNKDVVIIGGEVSGYQLRLGNEAVKDAVRLGLWLELEDAKAAAEQMISFTGGTVAIDIKTYEE